MQNMYVSFTDIEGECSAKGHEGEIEILSWNHGFNQPTSPTRSGAGAGTVEQATHQPFSFTKYVDSSSDDIISSCWGGKQVDEVIVSCYRADGATDNQPVKYLQITMGHVVVSGYSISGGPGDIPVENISLDYGTVEYNYLPQQRADGAAGGNEVVKHDLELREVS